MGSLPLSALLSQALVAYTIEFDNEFEERAPHITTVGRRVSKRGKGPWLVSQVMWTNFIQHIEPKGTPVRALQARACLSEPGIKSRLHHLEWWKYLTFEPDPTDIRSKPRYRDLLVHLTPGGERSRDEWQALEGFVDKRWTKRFGKDVITRLQSSLRAIVAQEARHLPDYLPVVDYQTGLRATLVFSDEPSRGTEMRIERLDLSVLIARALLVLTLEFESESSVSLPISANVLRVIEQEGTCLRDLPRHGGVAKEGVAVAINFLKKNGLVTVGTDKLKLVRLTAKGRKACDEYGARLSRIEKRWVKSFGAKTIQALREALESMGEQTKKGKPPLALGLEPAPGAWRTVKPYVEQTEAILRDPREALPHYPMVLHRGGFPDGA